MSWATRCAQRWRQWQQQSSVSNSVPTGLKNKTLQTIRQQVQSDYSEATKTLLGRYSESDYREGTTKYLTAAATPVELDIGDAQVMRTSKMLPE